MAIANGVNNLSYTDERENFLFNKNISCFLFDNGYALHQVHEVIFDSEDVFTTSQRIIDEMFPEQRDNPLFRQLIERIILRSVYLKYNFKFEKQSATIYTPVVLETTFRAPLVSIKYNDGGKNKCFSTDLKQIINYMDDPEILAFSECLSRLADEKNPLKKYFLSRYLAGKVRMLSLYTKNDLKFTVGRVNVAFNYLTAARKFIDNEFLQSKDVRVQIHELVGSPGIGKSQSLRALSMMLRALVPEIPKDQLIYIRAHDKWWNGYCGQCIIVYDDFSHDRQSKFDVLNELISIASGTFDTVPMAFAKDMIFTSSLIVATNNVPLITLASCKETAQALRRRIVSSQFRPDLELGTFHEGIYTYTTHALILNVLRGNNRLVFSMFAETVALLNQSQIIEFDDVTKYGFEEITPFSLSDSDSQSEVAQEEALLTSSVSKSSSVVASNGTDAALPATKSSWSFSSYLFRQGVDNANVKPQVTLE